MSKAAQSSKVKILRAYIRDCRAERKRLLRLKGSTLRGLCEAGLLGHNRVEELVRNIARARVELKALGA